MPRQQEGEKKETYVGVLLVDSSYALLPSSLLFVLVRNGNGVEIAIAMDDFETTFVCNPVAIIPER